MKKAEAMVANLYASLLRQKKLESELDSLTKEISDLKANLGEGEYAFNGHAIIIAEVTQNRVQYREMLESIASAERIERLAPDFTRPVSFLKVSLK